MKYLKSHNLKKWNGNYYYNCLRKQNFKVKEIYSLEEEKGNPICPVNCPEEDVQFWNCGYFRHRPPPITWLPTIFYIRNKSWKPECVGSFNMD